MFLKEAFKKKSLTFVTGRGGGLKSNSGTGRVEVKSHSLCLSYEKSGEPKGSKELDLELRLNSLCHHHYNQ